MRFRPIEFCRQVQSLEPPGHENESCQSTSSRKSMALPACFLVFLATVVLAAPHGGSRASFSFPDSPAVQNVNDTNWKTHLGGGVNDTVILFYASWCPHCSEFHPIFVKVAEELSAQFPDHSIQFVQIDADKERGLGGMFGVQSFPTIKFLPHGSSETSGNFNGARNVEAFKNWVLNRKGKPYEDPLLLLTATNLTTVVNGTKSVALLIGAASCAPCKAFESVLREAAIQFTSADSGTAFGNLSSSLVFARLDGDANPDLKARFAVTAYPWLVMIPAGFTNGTLRFSGVRDPETVAEWIFETTHGAPAMSHVEELAADDFLELLDPEEGADTAPTVVATFSQPWLVLWLPPPCDGATPGPAVGCEPCRGFAPIFNELSAEVQDVTGVRDVRFVRVMVGTDGYLKKKFGINQYPTVMAFQRSSTKQAATFDGKRNQKVLHDWVLDHVHPDSRPYDLMTLTDATFDGVVNGSRNVVVDFYATWCGHCKALYPVMLRVGQAFRKSQNVIFAKAEVGDANKELKARFGIKGFPTVLFFRKGGSTATPAKYDGPRTPEAIGTWVSAQESFYAVSSARVPSAAAPTGKLDEDAEMHATFSAFLANFASYLHRP
ncbi:putative protein disulfide isomerase [Paratrimastix pyriformis]|uniref:Thioredoxin domain-containing protein n=1 Tax=Paratrimastix pyriformis TaxID=342808 RepID=A0ABQ8UTK5_9EUKA|nr:putative protein disulfide isomerase [Paratrimastix pyriformis]